MIQEIKPSNEIIMCDAAELIPYPLSMPMPEEDRDNMKADINKRGIQTALIVHKDKNGKRIVAGNSRYEIGKELGIKQFPCRLIEVPMEEYELEEYVIMDNVARRHLTTPQKVEYAMRLEKIEKEKAKIRQSTAGNKNLKKGKAKSNTVSVSTESVPAGDVSTDDGKEISKDESVPVSAESALTGDDAPKAEKGKARDIACRKVGISTDTVRKGKKIKEASPETWDKVMAGDKNINSAFSEVNDSISNSQESTSPANDHVEKIFKRAVSSFNRTDKALKELQQNLEELESVINNLEPQNREELVYN
ncbi:MAG: ParB N-terminal domain-containing protein, partial [Dissulfurispiraceae bacterium]